MTSARRSCSRLILLAAMLHALAVPCVAAPAVPEVSVQRHGRAVVIDVTMTVAVPPAVAWEVLTDFDHMAAFLPNLEQSESQLQDANTYLLKQKGRSRHGLFSFEYDSLRRVELFPFTRIEAHNIAGNIRKMASTTTLAAVAEGVALHYHAEGEVDFWLPPFFGPAAMRADAEAGFRALAAEMDRRHGKP